MSEAKFAEMMSKSPRQVRETLFNRLNIKASATKSVVPRPHQKNEERIKKLHGRLAECPPSAKNEQELCEELIRNWLVHKTPILVTALDHFQVKHENGLTEQEIDFFETLEEPKVAELTTLMLSKHEAEEVAVYLRFMKVPHLKGKLPEAAYPKDAPRPLTEEPETAAPQAAAG